MEPVIKWAGGKRKLLPHIIEHLPNDLANRRFFEPFVGGGAVVFGLHPENAVINDYNRELYNLYMVIKRYPNALMRELKKPIYANTEEAFYAIRDLDRDAVAFRRMRPIQKAARTLYLNHTCYNGLFRVNSKGLFNTPFGKYANPKILDEDNIIALSRYLRGNNIILMNGDYQRVLEMAQPGDFVYMDPPYAPLTATSSFTAYIAGGWDDVEQVRLKEVCDDLTARGVLWMQSNSSAPLITELYQDYHIYPIEARRAVGAKSESRIVVTEYIITNYE